MNDKTRWSWDKWLKAMESCPLLSADHKELATRFRQAFRGKRMGQSIGPWQIEGQVNYGDLVSLQAAGFVYLIPGNGYLVPLLDPLPQKDSVQTTLPMRRLLRLMMKGNNLYQINRAGYITTCDDPRRWLLRDRRDVNTLPLNEDVADALCGAWLIERDGCGHGWPFQWTSRYQPNHRRLVGVRGFRKSALEVIMTRIGGGAGRTVR